MLTTTYYIRFNEYLDNYRKNNNMQDRVSIKIFAIPIIKWNRLTRYYKDIDKQMNKYIQYISQNLSMKKFTIVTGDAHFYESIYSLVKKNIQIHIIAHEGSMSNIFKNYKNFNRNKEIYTFTLIKREDYLRDIININ